MFRSPDYGSVSDVNPWWPGANYVDIEGMDHYPQREQFLPVPTTLSTMASQRNTTSTSVSVRLAPGPMLFPPRSAAC